MPARFGNGGHRIPMWGAASRFFASLPLVLLSWSAQGASPVDCGATISTPGEYYLASDCSGSGMFNLIISSNGVNLNLAGRTITCVPPDPKTAVTYGVYAQNVSAVLIRNGKITGCWMGLIGAGSSISVRYIDFSGNTYIGASTGSRSSYRNNIFANIAGYSAEPYAIGINCPGDDTRISFNQFYNLHRQVEAPVGTTGQGVAILVCDGETGVIIENNWIENAVEQAGDIAVWVAENGSATIRRNTIIGFPSGIASGGAADVKNNNIVLRNDITKSFGVGGSGSAAGNRILGFDDPLFGDITDGGKNMLY